MVGSLVFVLTLLGFALLMIGERVGLSVVLGLVGLNIVLALAFLALGLGSVTSRFARFAGDARAGDEGPALTTFVARCTSILVALFAFGPAGLEVHALVPGFVAGFALAHLGTNRPAATPLAARLARLLLGLVFVLLALSLLSPILETLSGAMRLSSVSLRLAVGALMLVVLLPGGARGAGRVQRLILALALVGALLPMAALGAMAATERGDALVFEVFLALGPMARAAFTPLLPAFAPGMMAGLVFGAAGGLAARGTGRVSGLKAAAGLLAGVLVAAGLVLLQGGAAEWLARIVGQRIIGLPPTAWPPFVFEPELSGWLRACGTFPVDPLAVERACHLSGAARVPKSTDITFLATLSLPALAVVNRLPVLLGEFWALLPVLLGTAGLLSVLHGAALAVSESVLFGLFNPSGLQSFRLAMARLSLLALVLALLGVERLPGLPTTTLANALAILLGVAAILLALSHLKRSPMPETAT